MLANLFALALQAGPCEAFLVDSGTDQLIRLVDLDGDGRATGVHEATAFWTDVAPSTLRALDIGDDAAGVPVAVWADSSRDWIFCASDENGNGRIEAFEERLFRDTGTLDGKTTAIGLARQDDGSVWWTSDAGRIGLFRIADLDGDGLAAAPGELAVLVDGDAPHPVETDAGPQVMDSEHVGRLASNGRDVAVYVDGDDEAVFVFADGDGDGDVLDAGESRLFCNASGKNPSLPRNADWAAGVLRSLTAPLSGGGNGYARLSHLAVATEQGGDAWYLASDASAGGPYAFNQLGEGTSGLVFRGVDANGDGDLQDPGEVRRFYDGSSTTSLPYSLGTIIGVDACGGSLFVAYVTGAIRRVARLVDADGDGDAEDPGEIEPAFFDETSWSGVAPFVGSTFVRGLVAVPGGAFGEPNGLFRTDGVGCALTPTGIVPTLHGVGRARLGTSGFRFELRGAAPWALALVWLGDDATNTGGLLLPVDLGPGWNAPGCYFRINAYLVRPRLVLPLPGDPLGGRAEIVLQPPPNPALAGEVVTAQWVVLDAGGGFATTGRGEVEVEP
jgi:hypothetical protein